MAINKRKVLEAARKYAQKGAQAKALKEFGKLLKLDPRDARLRLEVGDAHRRWGNAAEAIDTYKKVAEQYMKEGFDARAVAVYKQIHNLAPTAYESYEPLADLYQRMGLVSEAILALQTAADGYHKEGKKKEALDLLRKMATLDPTNTTSRIKVADLLRQEDLLDEALKEYVEAGAELERQGDPDGAVSVYERILEIEPDRTQTVQLLVENLVERGLADRAEPFAKRVLEANPDEPGNYELVATVFRLQKRDDELVEIYRKLADLYRRRGDDEQAREILQRYVPSEGIAEEIGIDEETAFGGMDGAPDLGESGTFGESFSDDVDEPLGDLSDTGGLGGLDLDGNSSTLLDDEMLASSASGDDGSFLTLDDERVDDVPLELDEALEPVPEPEPAAAAKSAPEQEPTPRPPVADPDQLLAEASVYLRYGKRDQAIVDLEAIIEQDGEHRAALEKLGEAYAEDGDGPKAVGVWLRAFELARSASDADGVSVLRDRIAAIDETAAAELDAELAVDGPSEEPAASAEGEVTTVDLDAMDSAASEEAHEIDLDDIEIDLDDPAFSEEISGLDDGVDGDEAPAAEAPAPEAPTEGPDSSSAVVQQIGEDLEEADFYMNQGLADEAEVIYKRVLSIAPNHPHALVRLGEVAAMRGDDPSATQPGPAASPDPGVSEGAAEGAVEGGIEIDEPEWNDEIAGPDDVELAPPTLEYSEVAEPPVASEPETAADGEEASLEDDLASQFLAEVAESDEVPETVEAGIDVTAAEAGDSGPAIDIEAGIADEAQASVETGADSGIADELAGGAALESAEASDVSDDTMNAEDPVAADVGDTLGTSDGADGGSKSGAKEEPTEITSPDDSFTDPSMDLGEAPELVVPATAAAAGSSQSPSEDSFDLAAELSGVFDDDPNGGTMSGLGDSHDGFAAVFDAFKKGVSQTLSEDDHEAHFDLGIAYREMGLLADAVSEFQAAMLNVDREVECRHMLGMCCFEQEQYEEAISHFEWIAGSPAATEEQQLSAQFELGRGWEALGDPARARTAWEAVAAVDAEFCDVTSLLAALDEAPKPEASADDLESFEDLLEDEVSADADADQDPDTDEYESFDGFLDDDAEIADSEPVAEAEPVAVQEPAVEARPEPEPESEVIAEAVEEPEPPRPRKRKKISFV